MEGPRRLVCEEHVDTGQRLTGEDLVAHEMTTLFVAALPEFHRRARETATARRRQRRDRRVIPAWRERPAKRRHAPRTDAVGAAIGQVMQIRKRRMAGHGGRDDVEVL